MSANNTELDKEYPKIMVELAKISSGQEYITKTINEFKEDMKTFKKEITEKVENYGDDIKDLKHDVYVLKKDSQDYCGKIKNLEDERNVNIVKMGTSSMPLIVKVGIAALIISVVIGSLSQFLVYQQTIQKFSNLMQQPTQSVQMQKGGTP